METIKEIKKQLEITNKDIAKMFGYKNLSSYSNASRKKHIENGIVELFKLKTTNTICKGCNEVEELTHCNSCAGRY